MSHNIGALWYLAHIWYHILYHQFFPPSWLSASNRLDHWEWFAKSGVIMINCYWFIPSKQSSRLKRDNDSSVLPFTNRHLIHSSPKREVEIQIWTVMLEILSLQCKFDSLQILNWNCTACTSWSSLLAFKFHIGKNLGFTEWWGGGILLSHYYWKSFGSLQSLR